MNLFVIIYFGSFCPFNGRLKNRMEIFNEACILFVTLHLFCYTEWVESSIRKYEVGWSQIFLMYFCFIVNFIVILWHFFRNLFLLAIKYYRRIKHWYATSFRETMERFKDSFEAWYTAKFKSKKVGQDFT